MVTILLIVLAVEIALFAHILFGLRRDDLNWQSCQRRLSAMDRSVRHYVGVDVARPDKAVRYRGAWGPDGPVLRVIRDEGE